MLQNSHQSNQDNNPINIDEKRPSVRIEISKYGNRVLFSDANKPCDTTNSYPYRRYEDEFPELKGAKECNTYDKVLNLLSKIKANPACEKIVMIKHEHNSHYRGHDFKLMGYHHTEKLDDMISFIRTRHDIELKAKHRQIDAKLRRFQEAILKLERTPQVDAMIKSPLIIELNKLYRNLDEAIFSDTYYPNESNPNQPKLKGPNLNETPYPDIIHHFTQLTNELAKNPNKISDKLIASSNKLQIVLHRQPMSERTRASIYGAMGAVVGLIIGAIIGAAATFWSGGVGAIPGAILGGSIGATTGSIFGFFDAKNKHRIRNQRERDYKDGNLVNKPPSYFACDIAEKAMGELNKIVNGRAK